MNNKKSQIEEEYEKLTKYDKEKKLRESELLKSKTTGSIAKSGRNTKIAPVKSFNAKNENKSDEESFEFSSDSENLNNSENINHAKSSDSIELVANPNNHANLNNHANISKSISYESFKEIFLNRDFLLENVYKPFFSKIVGNYVRILSKDSGYLIFEIINVVRGNEYSVKFMHSDIKTNLYLETKESLKLSSDNKNRNKIHKFSLEFISNSFPNRLEFSDFDFRNISQSKITELSKKKLLFKKRLNSAEEAETLKERQKFNKTNTNIARKKIEYIRMRIEAEAQNDTKKVERLNEMIRELDTNREVWGSLKLNKEKMFSIKEEDIVDDGDDLNPCKRRK